ncbi:LytTR family DNA-binding domain-containing protein [Dyadobacter sp. CY323]|uniref:LytR/AlgR family response regulator transcription factor n=1 Tax=Dyadobacter sp. CY323 TaxID=2907302 RepID=UPI001F45DA64|nr:LytTR family DNA-binding domain-containing protein [Dyadobacter sp. CY323]MCE6991969.1 LytTR family DNA-binding domain-containing protein [Dyadobacter sp. CY323]
MKTLLIDDEQPNLDNLRILLETYCPLVDIVGTARNTVAATSLLYSLQPDLVFLDIQMPEQNGFDWLRSLPACHFEVIFVTAYDQYAIQALRFSAVDYLLKPVAIGELQAAVERAHRQRLLKQQNELLQNLIQTLKESPARDEQRIALPAAKETHFVKIGDIVRCESSNNYTTFYLTNGEVLIICKPIFFYNELLEPYGFVRCHQSHLVNKMFIKSWKKEFGDFLLLTNGSEVPISRSKRDELKKKIM